VIYGIVEEKYLRILPPKIENKTYMGVNDLL